MSTRIPEGSAMTVEQALRLNLAAYRNGYGVEHLELLINGDILKKALPVLRGYAEIVPTDYVIDFDADPVPPKGLTVRSHQRTCVGNIVLNRIGDNVFFLDPDNIASPRKIDLFRSRLQTGKKITTCIKIRAEVAGLRKQNVFPLDSNCLDFFLAHPHIFPDHLKFGKNGELNHIYFWGTTFSDRDGRECVRCASWDKEENRLSDTTDLLSNRMGHWLSAAVLRRK